MTTRTRLLLLSLVSLLLAALPAGAQGEIDEYVERVFSVEPERLVAYWPLDGNAQDYSGNGYHGTAVGVVWAAAEGVGDGSGSAWFDGINDTIACNTAGEIGTNFSAGTVGLWLRPEPDTWTDGISHTIFNTGRTGQPVSVSQRYTGNSVLFTHLPWNVTYDFTPEDRWYFFAFTWDDSTDIARYYLNGLEIRSAISTTPFTSGPFTNCGIGGNGAYWGYIAHVMLYDEALSPVEVETLASVPPGPELPAEPDYYLAFALSSGQQARLWYDVRAGDLLVAGMVLAVLISQMIDFGITRSN